MAAALTISHTDVYFYRNGKITIASWAEIKIRLHSFSISPESHVLFITMSYTSNGKVSVGL